MGDQSLMSYNHGDALLTYLQQLQQSQRFTDVVIQCEGTIVNCCHRIILAAYSNHFESALAGVEGSSQITLDIDPKVTGVSIDDLRNLLDFMYTGRLTVTATMNATAKALGVVSLLPLLKDDPQPGCLIESESHANILLTQCRRYYQEGKFTDVSIHCQGTFMTSCHRLVLSAYSDHFEAALVNTENCPQVTLDIDSAVTGVTSVDLRSIIDFMYYGVVRMSRRRLKSLSAAGKSLGVSKLAEILNVHETPAKFSQTSIHTSSMDGVFSPPSSSTGLDGTDHHFGSLTHGVDQFGVDNVGATEDVGGGDMDEGVGGDSVVGHHISEQMTMQQGIAGEETAGDEDNPDDIYDEYVSGPRRRKNPLGTYRGQMKVKSYRESKNETNRINQRGPGASTSGGVDDDSEDLNASLFIEDPHLNADNSGADDDIAAVTLSLTAPLAKRRRSYLLDTYGYGLPEIVGTADVTVPLMVGDQQLMMEKPFKCPYCDHRTKEKSALEKHVRCIHTLEAPYKCRYCNQAFKVQSNLVRHIRAHTGEKPYVCKKCGAAYADKKNMDAHVFREHLKMRPLECPAPGCSAKFWRQDRFNYHCRRQHGLEPPEGPA